jgi:hypothetical protein
MILVRQTFQGQFGSGGKLAAAMIAGNRALAEVFTGQGSWRVLTDLSGAFDTVTLELEVESLAAWEQLRAQIFTRPELQELMASTAGLIASGHSEYCTIEAAG